MKVTVEAAGHTYTFQDSDLPRNPDQLATLMRLFPEVMFGYDGGWRQKLRIAWKDVQGKLCYGEVNNVADLDDIVKGINHLVHPLPRN